MLMKAQVLYEEELDRVARGEEKEMVMQYLKAGRKKSAHSSVLGKRDAAEAGMLSSPTPRDKPRDF